MITLIEYYLCYITNVNFSFSMSYSIYEMSGYVVIFTELVMHFLLC